MILKWEKANYKRRKVNYRDHCLVPTHHPLHKAHYLKTTAATGHQEQRDNLKTVDSPTNKIEKPLTGIMI